MDYEEGDSVQVDLTNFGFMKVFTATVDRVMEPGPYPNHPERTVRVIWRKRNQDIGLSQTIHGWIAPENLTLVKPNPLPIEPGLSPVLQQWRLGPKHGSYLTVVIGSQEYVIVRLLDQFVLREYEEGDETVYRPDRSEP